MTSQKKPFVSDKLAKRRKGVARARRFLSLAIAVLIVSGAGFLTYANKFQIKNISINGSKAVSVDEIKASAQNSINGRRIIIPKSNIFFYPKDAMKASLASAFPRLDTISVEVKNKALSVDVTEREPVYLWCGESIPTNRALAFDTTCYFVDAKGFIFAPAPQFSDTVYKKIYTSLPQSDNPIGQYAMDPKVLANVSIFAKEIEASVFKPTAFSVTANGDALIFMYRDSDTMPEVRYNPTHDPLADVAGFKTAISSEPLKTKLVKDFTNLEYIDLRFANKVFYKFHDVASEKQGDEQKTE